MSPLPEEIRVSAASQGGFTSRVLPAPLEISSVEPLNFVVYWDDGLQCTNGGTVAEIDGFAEVPGPQVSPSGYNRFWGFLAELDVSVPPQLQGAVDFTVELLYRFEPDNIALADEPGAGYTLQPSEGTDYDRAWAGLFGSLPPVGALTVGAQASQGIGTLPTGQRRLVLLDESKIGLPLPTEELELPQHHLSTSWDAATQTLYSHLRGVEQTTIANDQRPFTGASNFHVGGSGRITVYDGSYGMLYEQIRVTIGECLYKAGNFTPPTFFLQKPGAP